MGKSSRQPSGKSVKYRGKHIQVVDLDGWEYVERNKITGVVVIIALTRRGEVLLVEQFRKPVGKTCIELPAGLAGDIAGQESEDFSEAARRELLEETGYSASSFTRLSHGPPSAGLSSEVVTFYGAKGLKKVDDGGGDESENIIVHKILLDELPKWLKQQEAADKLIDPKVYAGMYFAEHRGSW